METKHFGERLLLVRGLGNFLSGMETDWDDAKAGAVRSLGNFLSGMETPQRLAGRRSL